MLLLMLVAIAYGLIAARVWFWHFELVLRAERYFNAPVRFEKTSLIRPLIWPYLVCTEPKAFFKSYVLGKRSKIQLVDKDGRVRQILD